MRCRSEASYRNISALIIDLQQINIETFKSIIPKKIPVKASSLAGKCIKWRCRGEALLRNINALIYFMPHYELEYANQLVENKKPRQDTKSYGAYIYVEVPGASQRDLFEGTAEYISATSAL